MDKKSVKKYIILALCLILVIAAIAISVRGRGVSAGAGKGKNQTVTDLASLSKLLTDGATLSPLPEASSDSRPNMTLKSSFSHYEVVGFSLSGIPTNIQYTATAYLSEDEMLFEIDMTHSSAQGALYATMQIYRNKERTLLRFERVFGAVAGNVLTVPDILLGKWLDVAEVNISDILETLSFSVDKHLTILDIVARTVADSQTDGFSKVGQKYTMTSETFLDFGAQILSLDGIQLKNEETYKGKFEVNLSSKKRPKVSYTLDAKQTIIDKQFSIVTTHAQLYETVEYTFSNIGNTVIKMPNNLKIVGTDEFNAYMEALK